MLSIALPEMLTSTFPVVVIPELVPSRYSPLNPGLRSVHRLLVTIVPWQQENHESKV